MLCERVHHTPSTLETHKTVHCRTECVRAHTHRCSLQKTVYGDCAAPSAEGSREREGRVRLEPWLERLRRRLERGQANAQSRCLPAPFLDLLELEAAEAAAGCPLASCTQPSPGEGSRDGSARAARRACSSPAVPAAPTLRNGLGGTSAGCAAAAQGSQTAVATWRSA